MTRLVALALLLLLLQGCFCPAGTAVVNAEAGSAEERRRPSKITFDKNGAAVACLPLSSWLQGGAMVTKLPGVGAAAVPGDRHRVGVVRFCPALAILG